MARDVFSVPIFFIVFRETIEAAIIISVLLAFVKQMITTGSLDGPSDNEEDTGAGDKASGGSSQGGDAEENSARVARLLKRLRVQIWLGAGVGFFVALAVGAAFIAVFYTKLRDLWGATEYIWEGVFALIAAIMILSMGVAFLKMDRAQAKWRVKLAHAFEAQNQDGSRSSKYALFLLPFITVLREGLEAVVFVGGVSLTEKATSIPLAVVVGLIAGACVGFAIYRSGSGLRNLRWFLVASTAILFLVGAGLFTRCAWYFETYVYNTGVGGDVGETGDGPGSYRYTHSIFHFTYGNPEPKTASAGGWSIFNAILGWNNTGTYSTVLCYIAYWLIVALVLVHAKWSEGRVAFCGIRSAAGKRIAERRTSAGSSNEQNASEKVEKEQPTTPGEMVPELSH